MNYHVPIIILTITFSFLIHFSSGFLYDTYLEKSFRMIYNMNSILEQVVTVPIGVGTYMLPYPFWYHST